ncbi:MAG TPA: CIA30 family protein [Quisquiliibacterium sp.]|nr:CIA30 family protein [Quisquiliibacterium sp.]
MPLDHAAPPLLDFSDAAVAAEFRVINDGVMGGVSSSRLRFVDGALRFEGEVSLENNGGFASFRGPVRVPTGAAGLLVTLRGDGQRYKLTLKLDDSNATAQYQARFTAPREWTTLRFSPEDFTASFRGRPVAAPTIDFSEVRTVGVLISDGQAGSFGIELRAVRTD